MINKVKLSRVISICMITALVFTLFVSSFTANADKCTHTTDEAVKWLESKERDKAMLGDGTNEALIYEYYKYLGVEEEYIGEGIDFAYGNCSPEDWYLLSDEEPKCGDIVIYETNFGGFLGIYASGDAMYYQGDLNEGESEEINDTSEEIEFGEDDGEAESTSFVQKCAFFKTGGEDFEFWGVIRPNWDGTQSYDPQEEEEDNDIPEAGTEDEFDWNELDDGSAEISNYGGTSPKVVIPSVIAGRKVKAVGYSAFYSCDELEQVVIPDSVELIDESAFEGCENLKKVVIGNGVKVIGARAFCDCINLTEVVFGKNIKEIGDEAFSGCSKLKSADLPDGLEEMGDEVFFECESITKATIPGSLKEIGGSVFEDCSKLSDVTIEKGVKDIGESTFRGCESLKKVVIPEGVKEIKSDTFNNCEKLNEVVIPKSVEKIEEGAFDFCGNLKKVEYKGTKKQWEKIRNGDETTTETVPVKCTNAVIKPSGKAVKKASLKAPKVTKFSVKAVKKGKAKITLKRIKGAKKLAYRYKLNSKKKKKEKWSKKFIKPNKKATYTVKGLKKGKKYQFAICYQKNKKWSKWSKSRIIKIK